jgi:K(+)-stimulated pyrophosphate-energized sodium pump
LSGLNLAAQSGTALELQGIDFTLVIVVMAVALLALAVAGMLVREVLAAGQGTERMRNIAVAVQEGAAAYLKRQFRTLAVFVVAAGFFAMVTRSAVSDLMVVRFETE